MGQSNRKKRTTICRTPELGLVCQTLSQDVRFRTITLSRYRSLTNDQKRLKLAEIYRDNLASLLAALGFCQLNAIRLYRMPSGLFPMSDHRIGEAILRKMSNDLKLVGRLASLWSIRIVMHPDQFVVLNSHNLTVVKQSVTILSKQAMWMDLMGLPRSPWSAMILHGGSGGRAAELIQIITGLPKAIRTRLVLENDEWTYGASHILDVCKKTRTPMVFDAHHHLIKEQLSSYDDASVGSMMAAAAKTWPDPEWAITHISNGQTSLHDRRHSEYIECMPESFCRAPWIEVEAKAKERAIADLRARWLRPRRRK